MSETLGSALIRAARVQPDRVFVQLVTPAGDDEAITFGQLAHRGSAIARQLQERAVVPGDVVFCILHTGRALIETFAGALLAGAVPAVLPFPTPKLDPCEYRRRMRSVTEYSAPRVIVTSDELHGALSELADGVSSVRAVVTARDAAGAEHAAIPDSAPAVASDAALLQYSSGTTGLQKGVLLSHDAVFTQVRSYSEAIGLQHSDVTVSWLPLYHDMGLIAGFLMPLVTGTRLVLMSPFDWVRQPSMLLHAISRHRATLMWLPNFALPFLANKVRDRELDGVRLDSLRAVINCSEPMLPESHEQFARRYAAAGFRASALATCYAMAENTFAVTQSALHRMPSIDQVDRAVLARERRAVPSPDAASSSRLLSAGAPIPGVEVRVIDAQGASLPERTVGEIAVRSGCMLSGYFRRPDLTAEAFLDGWFLTGDYGYLADGELYVTGRKKDLIIVGGQNLFPQDIEAAVEGIDGVHPGRIAAFGLLDPATGTETVAIVAELDPAAWPLREDVAAAIRERVARRTDAIAGTVHLVPAGWLVKTSSGKVARSANREKYCREADIAV